MIYQGYARLASLYAGANLFETGQNMLFTTDSINTINAVMSVSRQRYPCPITPWGCKSISQCDSGLHGQWQESAGYYLLGNGYRAYMPGLMRFASPDSLSPFGLGGRNAYGFCAGDPLNSIDPSGHMPLPIKAFMRSLDEIVEAAPDIAKHLKLSDTVALSSTSKLWKSELGMERAAAFRTAQSYAEHTPDLAHNYVMSRLTDGVVPSDTLLQSWVFKKPDLNKRTKDFLLSSEGGHPYQGSSVNRLDRTHAILNREFPIPQTEEGRLGYAVMMTRSHSRMVSTVEWHLRQPSFWLNRLPARGSRL